MKKMSGFCKSEELELDLGENNDTEDDAIEQDLIGMTLANVLPSSDIPKSGEDSPATFTIPNDTIS